MYGDLLFAINPDGNEITEVTRGVNGLQIDHVAAYIHYVIEAIPDSGVVESELPAFIENNKDSNGEAHVLVMRIDGEWDKNRLPEMFSLFERRPYDDYFESSDDALYCSELIQKCYYDMAGNPIFETIPMEFRNEDGEIPHYWTDFYSECGKEVPEGEPGTNPGQISRSPRLKIVGWLK